MRTVLNTMLCPVFMLTIVLSRFPSASWVCTSSKAANRLWCTSAAWVGTVFGWTWEKRRLFLTIRLQSPVQCSEVRIVFLLCAYLCNYLDWMSWAILLPSFSLSWGLCIFFSISCIYDTEYLSIIKFCHSFFQLLFKIISKYTEDCRPQHSSCGAPFKTSVYSGAWLLIAIFWEIL